MNLFAYRYKSSFYDNDCILDHIYKLCNEIAFQYKISFKPSSICRVLVHKHFFSEYEYTASVVCLLCSFKKISPSYLNEIQEGFS